MTLRLLFRVATSLAAVGVVGCSSASSTPDPTSREALRKAPPIEFGMTCTKVVDESYGTAHSHDETPVCLGGGGDCNDLAPSSGDAFGGGDEYFGATYYEDFHWFEGTCENHKPITCDQRPKANACDTCKYAVCCVPIVLCEDDPNCQAVVACVTYCKDDKACAARCMQNGDARATKNLGDAVGCVLHACAKECGT